MLDRSDSLFFTPRELKSICERMQKFRLTNDLGIKDGSNKGALLKGSTAKKRIAGLFIDTSVKDCQLQKIINHFAF